MSLAFRLKMAKQKGEALLAEEGLTSLPVDPLEIAARRNIIVQAKPNVASGVSGMLLRYGNSFGIIYASDIPSEGFQRFSIAHELGHYFLDGHIDHVLPKDGTHTSLAGFASEDPYEREADSFAVGLLMPAKLFRRIIGRSILGLADIELAAETCKTSLIATAIRYVELTNDAVAIVVSTGRIVNYCMMSEAMKSLRDISWLKRGSLLPPNTLTNQFNADSSRVIRGERGIDEEVDILDWFGGKHSNIVVEEVIGLGGYGKTLTILSSQKIGQDADLDDDDEEEELLDSWTPRFRR